MPSSPKARHDDDKTHPSGDPRFQHRSRAQAVTVPSGRADRGFAYGSGSLWLFGRGSADLLDPQTVLAYAALLRPGALPPTWLVTVPGWVFAHGLRLSPATRASIDRFLNDEQGILTQLTATLQRLVAFHAPPL